MYASALFFLVTTFQHSTHPLMSRRVWPAVVATIAAVEKVGCFPRKETETQDEACERTARVALRWQHGESSLLANPKGSNDDGQACGAMQVNVQHIGFEECRLARKSYRHGVEIGVRMMLAEVARCGGVVAGLGAYSTKGQCGGAPMLIARRCAEAGGC